MAFFDPPPALQMRGPPALAVFHLDIQQSAQIVWVKHIPNLFACPIEADVAQRTPPQVWVDPIRKYPLIRRAELSGSPSFEVAGSANVAMRESDSELPKSAAIALRTRPHQVDPHIEAPNKECLL